jgi:hypothetical protein
MARDEHADPETRRTAIRSLMRLRADLAALVPGTIRLLVKAVYHGEIRCGELRLDPDIAESRLVESRLLTAPELALLSEAAALALALRRFALWQQTGEPPG